MATCMASIRCPLVHARASDTAEAITDQPGRRADVPPPAKRVPGSGTCPLYAFTFYCRRFRALGRRPRCWMPLPLGSRTGGRAPRGHGVRCRSRDDIFPRGESTLLRSLYILPDSFARVESVKSSARGEKKVRSIRMVFLFNDPFARVKK